MSWLKINHPDVVSKTYTASSPHNTQISKAQQAPMSSTQVISPSVSCESPSTQSVSQSSPLLLQRLYKYPCLLSTPAIAGPSSSSQDQSAPSSTPLTTAAKRRSPLSDLLNLPTNIRKARSKTPSTGVSSLVMNACIFRRKRKRSESKWKRKKEKWREFKNREKNKSKKLEEAKKAAERG